jgi:hypothetical protein
VSISTDPRLVLFRLAGNWHQKIEQGQITIDAAFDLLLERLGAIVPAFTTCPTCNLRTCPNPAFCENCRKADQEIGRARRCAQCGACGELEPHKDNDQRKIVYLHKGCLRFWRKTHR